MQVQVQVQVQVPCRCRAGASVGAGAGAGAGDGGDGVDFGNLVGVAVPFLGPPLAIVLGFALRWRWSAGSVLRRGGGCFVGFRLFSNHCFWDG